MDYPEINGIPLKQDEENSIPRREMRKSLTAIQRKKSNHRSWASQKFGRHIHRYLPDVSEVRPLNQERNYRFPSLESCRLFIFEKYGIEIAKVDSNS